VSEEADRDLEVIAYYDDHPRSVELAPAARWRVWMNETDERWANRCLPLLMANESGWALTNPATFTATWTGGPQPSAATIEFADATAVPTPPPVESHFGYGVITWGVPFLFRTPPGYNLLVRGPANWPRDGICALEGLVETDWSVATFTMNWKLTRADHPVVFEEGEPFCMVVPQRRGELEAMRPSIRALASDPDTRAGTKRWTQSRHEAQVKKFLAQYSRDFADERSSWQQHYFRGIAPDGRESPAHQTQRRLAEFTEIEPCADG
jgi:hypothetical protein